MSIKGELAEIKLADILQMVALNGQEGTLVVSDADSKKWLYFSSEGISLLSSGKRQPTSLGQRLLALGKLTKPQLDDAVLEYRKSGKKLGQVLAERGIVSKEDVEDAVRAQIADEIFDLLEWEGAQFEFIPGPPLDNTANQPTGRHLSFDVNTILLEAARRADEWELVKHKVRSLNETLIPTALHRTQLDLAGEFTAAFALVDGRASIREIIQQLHMPRLEAAVLIGRLVETGAVRFGTKEELCRLAQSPNLKNDYERQAQLYELAVQRKDDPETRQWLAETLERAGRREAASAQYKALAENSLKAGDLHAGADFLRQVVRLAPTDKESRELLIDILLRLKSPAQAGIQIRRMAQVYAEEGHLDRAIEEYRRLLKISPGDFEAQKQIVELLVQLDRVQDAFSEAEVLETFAKTPSEHDQVMKFFGRLVATRPGFTAAQKKLERISRQERQKTKVRALSGRALVVGGLAVLALVGWLTYEWLAVVTYRPIFDESARWAAKNDYQTAVRVLQEKKGAFPYSRAERSVEPRIMRLLEEEQLRKTEHQEAIAQKQKEAADKEQQGDLKGAAEALMWAANEIKNDDYRAYWKLKEKADEWKSAWEYVEETIKSAQEQEKTGQYREAHTRIHHLFTTKDFTGPARLLNPPLPIHLASTPPGAKVMLGDTKIGETPVIVHKEFEKPLTLTLTGPQGQSASYEVKNEPWQQNASLPQKQP